MNTAVPLTHPADHTVLPPYGGDHLPKCWLCHPRDFSFYGYRVSLYTDFLFGYKMSGFNLSISGVPGGSDGRESACNAGDLGAVQKTPWVR